MKTTLFLGLVAGVLLGAPGAQAAIGYGYLDLHSSESDVDYTDKVTHTFTPPGNVVVNGPVPDSFHTEGSGFRASLPLGSSFYAKYERQNGDLTDGCECTDVTRIYLAAGYHVELIEGGDLYLELADDSFSLGNGHEADGLAATVGFRYAAGERLELEGFAGHSALEDEGSIDGGLRYGVGLRWMPFRRVGLTAQYELLDFGAGTDVQEDVDPGPDVHRVVTVTDYEMSYLTFGLRVTFL